LRKQQAADSLFLQKAGSAAFFIAA